MKYVTGTTQFHIEGESAVSIGKFDGVHLGHRALIGHILKQKEKGLQAVIFTFEKNPTRILSGLSAQNIITNEERREKLEQMGIDHLLECPFVPEVSHMSPAYFAQEILVKQLHARMVCVGKDCRFGYKGAGDYLIMQELGKKLGFEVEVIEKEQSHGRDISSTYVREALYEGNIRLANELLGYPYFVTGEVLHGRRIGRTLGIPTINLMPSEDKLLPPNGVYLTKTVVDDIDYYGITNIGYKPTVGGETRKGVETYLFDFEGDLYGQHMKVEFLDYERPEQKFQSLGDLKARILSDIHWGKSRINC